MSSSLTSSNRINIPAVCRIADGKTGVTTGTGFLIGPGLIMTSTRVLTFDTAHTSTALFFENSKKNTIAVRFLPEEYYFEGKYPDYMDYCIVACERDVLFNIKAVELPLVQSKWPTVSEGDLVLVVQHIIGSSPAAENANKSVNSSSSGGDSTTASTTDQKRFEEVLRCRNNLCFLKATGSVQTAGCPVFNDNGQLVGLQSQFRSEGEGYLNRVLVLPAIVQHLFANSQLNRLPQNVRFNDVWITWFIEKDVSRIISIMANFRSEEMVRKAAQRLCDLTTQQSLIPQIIQCGGIPVILHNLRTFSTDVELAGLGLRALWNVSIGNDENIKQVVEEDGTSVIIVAMENFPQEESILEFGVVLLYNIYGTPSAPDFLHLYGERILVVLKRAVKTFAEVVVVQKFSFLLFTLLLKKISYCGENLMKDNIMQHVAFLIESKHKQVFLMEVVMQFVGELSQDKMAVKQYCAAVQPVGYSIAKVVELIVLLMLEYKMNDTILIHGNKALWGLGDEPSIRIIILQNPQTQEAFQASLPSLASSSRRV
ncbi:Trypsin-like peptidase domain containing protein, putative [Angomonas deanei]|uniref:Trypsin-like peptidase domain containing protein, putative n=1 Tax=Angomonas deanei TaxID=59799 RepID=A0A7G2C633_9TRYP|nr:Trypsin-like peptidase domain containing protein, putative [Angomonas deanei]